MQFLVWVVMISWYGATYNIATDILRNYLAALGQFVTMLGTKIISKLHLSTYWYSYLTIKSIM